MTPYKGSKLKVLAALTYDYTIQIYVYIEEEREKLEELMSERVKEWQGMDDNVKVTVVMDRACTDEDVGRAVERMWQRRFAAHGPHLSRHRCI